MRAWWLMAAVCLAGCQDASPADPAPPPGGPVAAAGWDAGEPFAVDGCIAMLASLEADMSAVATRLPPGFEPAPGGRPLAQMATCGSAAIGDAEPALADLFLALLPIVPHGDGGVEYYLLEASSSVADVNAVFQQAGVPNDLVEVQRPRAPAASWEINGNASEYTFTPPAGNTPDAGGRPDQEIRFWGGPDGLFTGLLQTSGQSSFDDPAMPCMMFVYRGPLAGIAVAPSTPYGDLVPCMAQWHDGGLRLTYDPPVAATV